MSHTPQNIFKAWQNGEIVYAEDLVQEREILRVAANDTYARVIKQYRVLNTDGTTKTVQNLDTAINTLRFQESDTITISLDNSTSTLTFEVVDGSVDTPALADGSVTTVKVADLAITAQKIANGTITLDQIDLTSLDSRYYTESEVDTKLSTKTDKTGDHEGTWQGLTPNDFDTGQQAQDIQELRDDVDAHVSNTNNPHNVTAVQIGAETPQGAQDKADAAEQNAKDYTDLIQLLLQDVGIGEFHTAPKPPNDDLNDVENSGFYRATNDVANIPTNRHYGVIHVRLGSAIGIQIAVSRSGSDKLMFFRHRTSAEGWQPWVNVATTDWIEEWSGLGTTSPKLSTDLNNERVNGRVYSNSSTLNSPPGSWYVVDVFVRGTDRLIQVANEAPTGTPNSARVFTRYLGSGGWSEWVQLLSSRSSLDASRISSGTLAVAHGGTGGTSKSAGRNGLGIFVQSSRPSGASSGDLRAW